MTWTTVNGASDEHPLNNFSYGAAVTLNCTNANVTTINLGGDGQTVSAFALYQDGGTVNCANLTNAWGKGYGTASGTFNIFNWLKQA